MVVVGVVGVVSSSSRVRGVAEGAGGSGRGVDEGIRGVGSSSSSSKTSMCRAACSNTCHSNSRSSLGGH
jgi:hypothetical protein